jgi:hypothetical protein
VGIAIFGLLHATAGGALTLAGIHLAVPGVLSIANAAEAAAQAVGLGLASLRVPLEAGDVHGTFAPLTGLALTLWGIASAARRRSHGSRGARGGLVIPIAIAFAIVCAGAAAGAGAGSTLEPSVPGATAAGLAWGAIAATCGTRLARSDDRKPRVRPGSALLEGHPRAGPGFVTTGVAGALAAVWFAVAVVLRVVGVPLSAAAGGILLGLAMLPNAVVALVAVGLGARVDAVAAGSALADPVRETFSLWDWAGSGVAPAHVLVLVAVPLAAALVGGRAAVTVAATDSVLARGLRNGVFFGAALVAAGWAGALQAGAGTSLDEATVRVSIPGFRAFVLALAWGVAGAWAGSRPAWPRRRSKVPST